MKNKIKTKYEKIKNNKIFPRVPERSEILLKCQNTQKHLRVSTSITVYVCTLSHLFLGLRTERLYVNLKLKSILYGI